MSKKTTTINTIPPALTPINESYQEAVKLKKSFDGATGLRPQDSPVQQTEAEANTLGASAMKPKITNTEK